MRLLCIVALLASVLGAGPGMAQSRHALVVGMQEHSHVSPLKKAANDARAVAAALKEAGFATEVVLDAFSPDGRRIVIASADKTARIWEVR